MGIQHVFTNNVADGTNTQIVRPSDWNSLHAYTLQDAVSLAGNTSGALANVSSGTLILAGGNNITLSQNGNSVTISGANAAPAPVNFSAGTASGDLGAVVFSNSGGVSFGLNGSTITAVVATNYQSQGAYLTTAALSQDSSKYAGVGESVGTVAGTDLAMTVNTDGVSILYPKWLTTAQPVGAYLTTARASNDAIGLNTAKTNVTWTANSSGLSLDAGGYAGTGFTTTSVAGAVVAGTHDTAGLKIAVPAYLTTAQPVGAYLTTARASNDAVGLNTALTANGVAWTVNSSGISLNVPAFLTTAMASNRGSDFVAATAAFAGTNASGTIASNGISVSVAAPGAAAENNWANLLGANTAGNTTASGSTIGFSGVNMTLSGTNNSQIVLSVPATSSLVGTNGISISTNGSTISVSYVPPSLQYFEADDVQGMALATNVTALNSRPFLVPFVLKGLLTNSSLIVQVSRATSASNAFTLQAGLYTYANSTSINLLGSLQAVYSNTDTGSVSGNRYLIATGWQAAATAMTPGNYVLALNFSAAATASMNYSLYGGVTASQPVGYIFPGSNSANTNNTTWGVENFWGRYTANSGALPAGIGQTDVLANWSGASQPIAPWFILRP